MKKINIYTEYLHQHLRNFIYYKKNKTNPFGDKIIGSKKRYLELYNNVKNIAHDKLIIIAAHRLSALIEFDEIIVLNNGKICEIGNHNELLKRAGRYKDYCDKQFIKGN